MIIIYLYTSENTKRCKSEVTIFVLFTSHPIKCAEQRSESSQPMQLSADDLLESSAMRLFYTKSATSITALVTPPPYWPPGQECRTAQFRPCSILLDPWCLMRTLLWILRLQRKDWSLRPKASPWRGTQSVISYAPLSAPFSTHRLSKSDVFELLGFWRSNVAFGYGFVFLARLVNWV
jgi:hypothetical protein